LNQELIRLKVKTEILTFRSKIPTLASIILTTSEEIHKFKKNYKKLQILPYHKNENFQHYILKILAAYKINYKDNYSVLIFSIDPGTSQIGIAVFLDDYYLQSHTIYKKEMFMEVINDYILCFQKEDSNPIALIFKFGRGVISVTIDLLNQVYESFKNRKSMKVCLVDESRTSKIKIQDKKKQVRTKHEVSALIIAMRKGIEVDSSSYLQIIRQNVFQNTEYHEREEDDWEEVQEKKLNLKKIVERILNDDISLSKSSELIKDLKIKPKRYYKRNPIKRIQY
jgi:RNase H-fold protein (predicted Holliday junction resolvase)